MEGGMGRKRGGGGEGIEREGKDRGRGKDRGK